MVIRSVLRFQLSWTSNTAVRTTQLRTTLFSYHVMLLSCLRRLADAQESGSPDRTRQRRRSMSCSSVGRRTFEMQEERRALDVQSVSSNDRSHFAAVAKQPRTVRTTCGLQEYIQRRQPPRRTHAPSPCLRNSVSSYPPLITVTVTAPAPAPTSPSHRPSTSPSPSPASTSGSAARERRRPPSPDR